MALKTMSKHESYPFSHMWLLLARAPGTPERTCPGQDSVGVPEIGSPAPTCKVRHGSCTCKLSTERWRQKDLTYLLTGQSA